METELNVTNGLSETELYTIFNKIKESLGYTSGESMTVFNTRIDSSYITLSNGEKHLLYVDKNQYDSKEFENILDAIYQTIFGSGKMYNERTKQWNKRVRQLKLKENVEIGDDIVNVSIITVASVLMSSKIKITSKYNTYSIMSELSYWLDSTKLF